MDEVHAELNEDEKSRSILGVSLNETKDLKT